VRPGLEPAVGLCPALLTVDHTSSVTCRYLPAFYAAAEVYCLVTEAHECEQLAHGRYAAAPGRGSNRRPLDRNPDALTMRHRATRSLKTQFTPPRQNMTKLSCLCRSDHSDKSPWAQAWESSSASASSSLASARSYDEPAAAAVPPSVFEPAGVPALPVEDVHE